MSDSQAPDLTVRLIASGLVDAHEHVSRGDPLPVPYPPALQRGLDRLTLNCLLARVPAPAGVPELLRWCEQPLGAWMPLVRGDDVDGDILLDAGTPTRACQEWAIKADDVESEVFENEVIDEVRRACRAAGRADSYVAFRELVIEHPVLTELEFQRRLMDPQITPIGEQLKRCYPPSPVEYERAGVVECCADCGNPLLHVRDRYQCADDRCPRRSGPTVGRALDVAAGVRCLAAPVRMFVASPGRAELRLRDALTRAGVEVELWPNFDAYDLRITFPDGQVWAVDVKDWSNPVLLARRLRPIPPNPRWDRSFIVPAREAVAAAPGYVATLRNRSAASRRQWRLEIASERRLLNLVHAKVRAQDA